MLRRGKPGSKRPISCRIIRSSMPLKLGDFLVKGEDSDVERVCYRKDGGRKDPGNFLCPISKTIVTSVND